VLHADGVLVNWPKAWNSLKSDSIARAFAISIALHFLTFFVIEAGHSAGMWEQRALPKFARANKTDPAQPDPNTPNRENEPVTLQFIEVDPAKPAEPPPDARYYSIADAQAASPDNKLDINRPKIDGTQDKVPRTRDVAKADPQPAVPPPQPQSKAKPLQPDTKQTEQAEAEPPGDTKQNTLTPAEKAQRDMTFDRPQQPAPKRPRTVADARAAKGIIEGPKMKQAGGVKRFAIESSENVRSSPFGSYDAMLIAAVQARWFQLLDQDVVTQSGKVVIDFRLYKDGRVLNMSVAENQASETLARYCQRAISDPSPYAVFPPDLKRLVKGDYREVRFTFYYN